MFFLNWSYSLCFELEFLGICIDITFITKTSQGADLGPLGLARGFSNNKEEV